MHVRAAQGICNLNWQTPTEEVLTQVKWSSLMEMHFDRLLTATAAMVIYQIHFPFVYTECIKKVPFEVAAIQISRNLLY